eukprot:TRINITY_DN23705_c0_g1_i1.p1 TRINITY_DN23705_c0_g1~~TRINITY_DN23705_c0_g1_i1.p1  ORF type:complete len:1941 (+),score=414.00 TRINITY_DN23705_c0_g1_i1:131-5953(+)
MSAAQFLRCLRVVVSKNFVLKMRSWKATLLELLLPVALMGLIIWIRTEITKTPHKAQSYVNSTDNNPTWFSSEPMNISMLGPNVSKTLGPLCGDTPTGLCPEIYSQATWNLRKEHYLGIALDGLLPLHMSAYTQQLGVIGDEGLADFITNLPGYKGLVHYFETQSDLDSYLSDTDYGFVDTKPQLFGLIDVRGVAKQLDSGKYDGDWDINIHLNATGPGSIDINGATDVNVKLLPATNPLQKSLNMKNTKIYWAGGLFFSMTKSGQRLPLATGGFVDLQTLVYAWIYNTTGAFSLPRHEDIPKCLCEDAETGEVTEDLGRCDEEKLLPRLLLPQWSSSALGETKMGCLGRLSGIFPLSVREIPMPTPAYEEDTFADIIVGVFGLFFTLVYLWPLTRIMKSLVEDKEARINEVMKMMAMPAEAITFGWYVTHSLLWLIPSILIPVICWTTVFEHSNKLIIFLFFWLFGVCVVAFCSLMAVFFEKAKTASVVGALMFFLLYFPYAFVNDASTAVGLKTVVSLCPPVVLSLGAALIAQLESAGDGVQFGNLGESVNNFNMARVFLMLIVDSGLFMFLAWYFDKVLVVGFGTRQPWYFLCRKRYWQPDISGLPEEDRRRLELAFDDAHPPSSRYEPVADAIAERRSVLLRDVQKQFKTQDGTVLSAVQGLTVNLYESQMFCLLGHNGAGKTTTINMLSGMLPIDGGDALMNGKSVKYDMPAIRKSLGVCPQHDVIWTQLTVREHLQFYAAVKGVAASDVDTEVNTMISDVGLVEKKNSLAGTLSGGQKRRLSAAIALIGGSTVVFLDEPSSGVDPFSRRELWACLKQKKEGRTMIMTTHFMNEAEELGDRIAIMASGQIKCVGSALFLKQSYGVGYTLTITKTEAATQVGATHPKQLKRLIKEKCPGADLLSEVGIELVYRMPMEQSRAFPSLFEVFEKQADVYGVEFFSVSVTTLEEVFLRVGQNPTEADMMADERAQQGTFVRQLSGQSFNSSSNRQLSGRQSSFGNGNRQPSGQAAGAPPSAATQAQLVAGAPPSAAGGLVTAMDGADIESMRTPLNAMQEERLQGRGPALVARHVHALMAKRYHNALRDKKAWCCQIGIPLVFLFFALASLKFTGIGNYDPQPLGLAELPGTQTITFAAAAGAEAERAKAFMLGLGADVIEATNSSAVGFDSYLLDSYYRADGKARYGAFRFQSIPDWTSSSGSTVDGWKVANFRNPGVVEPPPAPQPASFIWPKGFTVPVGTLWDETDTLPKPPLPVSVSVPMSQLNNRLQVDLFWNSTARDAVPIFYNELNNQLLKASLGADKVGSSQIKISNQPFPLTLAQKKLTDTQTSLFLALGFAFIPASYGAFVVLERETNSKHLQIISGVNFVAYWLSTWLWDIINYIVPAALSIALCAAFGMDSLTQGSNLLWTIIAVMGYGVSCTSFTYMLSYLFDSHTSAQNMLLIVYLFTGGILEIVAIVLALIPSTQNLMKNTLIYIFRLMPNYCLADSLTNLISRDNPFIAAQLGCPPDGCNAYDLMIIGYDLIYLFGGAFVWFLITLLLELALATPKLRAMLQFNKIDVPPGTADDMEAEDADVMAERERVQSGSADNEMVVLRGLRKVYPGRSGVPPKVAVHGMHFAISEGECFGYLGMNGAGKTTTMKMLTGEELCTDGGAWLGGFDIKTQQNQVRQLIGYCPQFDALIGTLTAREHLMLFARIKGYPAEKIRRYVDTMLDQLTLTPYADRQAMTFSGGTKRKLSLGIALIGNPKIIFLDEPTTGVDPESRRFLWKLISTTMQGRSVILTTHSMDECEALCARIGIMVNGKLRCLGSASHLKATHGSGYEFEVTFKPGCNLQQAFVKLSSFVQKRFPEGARVLEGAGSGQNFRQQVRLRLPKGRLPISAIFREVEEKRAELNISAYSVSETTLDQIFINFAKHQADEDTGEALVSVLSLEQES